MNVGNSVRLAILDWERYELESAMLHACNSIDGTARKIFPKEKNKVRFTKLLRENYSILGPMGAPGINLWETRFPLHITNPTATGGEPDLADVIYTIHRCSHGHGDELPSGFELIEDARGIARRTTLEIKNGAIRLSDRIIFGLIAVSVLSPVNIGQKVPENFYLTYGSSVKLIINEWWGRAAEFPSVAESDPVPLVSLNFSTWNKQMS